MVAPRSVPLPFGVEPLVESWHPGTAVEPRAGTYLCNATLYGLNAHPLEERFPARSGGFIHLPYLPEQVALLLAEGSAAADRARSRSDIAR